MRVMIREAEASDEAAWRRLWMGYLAHLNATVPDEITAHTWSRILSPGSPLFCRLAVAEHTIVGFAVCLLHEGSWALTPHCYLEDLYVAPESRGRGAGRALIEDIRALAKARGWNRLYWHTREDNPARHLYDGFASASGMVVYKLTP
jgi:GNAT superfamily N-acetyltransferase